MSNIECIKFALTDPSMQNKKWKILTAAGKELARKDKA